MAEFVLSKLAESVVAQTVQRISDLLIYEAASLASVRDDVVLLEAELISLQGFLKEADSKQEQDQRLRDLLIQVREIASDAEDVVETFIFKVSSSYIKASHNKRIRAQINSIRSRIQIIFRSMQIFEIKFVLGEGTSSSMVEVQRNLRRSYPDDEDDDVIILKGSKTALTALLKEEEEDRLCIVSVVGMGGLGKTTLAKKVYNSVKRHFDCSAWVFISQQFGPKDVLIDILIQVGIPDEKLGLERKKGGLTILEKIQLLNALKEHEIMHFLKDVLEQKRYLVVLDDIWRTEAWDRTKRAFPHGKKGSKLLFTTRNMEVATYADPLSAPIEPPLLTPEESWELLRRKALPKYIVGHGMRENCPAEYEILGKEMVKKCGGLPLAVVVLGGLLKTKNSLDEWKVVYRNVNAHLNKPHTKQQHGGLHEILALSYYDLPYILKPCFLYLANFPEDWEIPKTKIIRLWIAEGFIPTPTRGDEEETLEDIAEEYVRELIHRYMVQVSQRDYTGVGVKTCRMHDLMRDFCMLKAREENFSEIIQQIESSTNTSNQHVATTHSRRIVISPGCILDFNTNYLLPRNIKYAFWMEQIHPHLRSLLCFGTLSVSALISKNLSVLRVLEIELDKSMKMPGEIGNLIHLKYLCLKTSYRLKLPNTIGNLRNLHILDLHNCRRIINLPREIFKLVRLRHLLLPIHHTWTVPFHVRIGRLFSQRNYFDASRLTNIVTLKCTTAECLLKNDALLKLANLQNLGIVLENDEQLTAFLHSPYFQACRLRSLNIFLFAGAVFTSLEPLSTCHSLSKLTLRGTVGKEVDSNCRHILQSLPANLNKLVLEDTGLEPDQMPVLENLSNLRFLKICWGSYRGDKLVCSANGFRKLETLQLVDLILLKEWHMEEGALRSLKRLDIYRLSSLEMMPDGLRFVTSLKELNIEGMTKSFCERLHVKDWIEGADFYKVAHIPSISISDVR